MIGSGIWAAPLINLYGDRWPIFGVPVWTEWLIFFWIWNHPHFNFGVLPMMIPSEKCHEDWAHGQYHVTDPKDVRSSDTAAASTKIGWACQTKLPTCWWLARTERWGVEGKSVKQISLMCPDVNCQPYAGQMQIYVKSLIPVFPLILKPCLFVHIICAVFWISRSCR